ncbi:MULTISPECIES: hypothetical protein [unclassified Streptomyces]|uniref:hypothetical protein n=1 Tax=unclassified Streptomyces TaxID=2593676 RepID=UPI0025B59B31|nr:MULTISPECIES: hypothetical protein [unclassified Streptomyces]MDN3250393.1 hypothetical protein [Streptomyces sp. ZSW22]MDN3254359.1 hypothetical protein [Streptomyces sp. MA25(2023)]
MKGLGRLGAAMNHLGMEFVGARDLLDLVGSGVERQTTTGLIDEATLLILRAFQRKSAWTVSAYYGKRPDA